MKKINFNALPRNQIFHAKEIEGCLKEHVNLRGNLIPNKSPYPSNWLEAQVTPK